MEDQVQRYGVYDFLTDWGLRMASASPRETLYKPQLQKRSSLIKINDAGKGEAEMAEIFIRLKLQLIKLIRGD